MTSTQKAYPVPAETIAARLRTRTNESGETPSRNQIMTEFKVGAPKAKRVLDLLTAPEPATTTDQGGGRGASVTAEPVTDEHDDMPTDPFPVQTHPVDLATAEVPASVSSQVIPAGDPVTDPTPATVKAPPATVPAARSSRVRLPRHWPLLLLAAPAFVAIWGGWVGLGKLAGFGEIVLLPGIADNFTLDSSITLPIGVETYAAYALKVWLTNGHPPAARRFAKWSAIASLVLGMAGQVAYHLMTAAHMDTAPWQITTLVACLPVVVLGSGAALAHLTHTDDTTEVTA
ncbi:ABC transporter permease [Actinokineospora sp.]|uniref:ABC transporter permease n=1 Tax=Actinokineospora sp. TaxID=1872133 RepID=UPI003D6BE72A